MFEAFGVADWLVWYMIAQYVGMGVLGGYIVYATRFKIGYRAVFLRRVGAKGEVSELNPIDVEYGYKGGVVGGGQYQFVGDKDFRATAKEIRFRGGTFAPDLERVSYRKFGYQFLFFDFDSGSLLNFGGEFQNVDPDFAERHLTGNVVKNFLLLSSGMPRVVLFALVFAVVATGVAAGVGGYLLGGMGGQSNRTVTSLVGVLFG